MLPLKCKKHPNCYFFHSRKEYTSKCYMLNVRQHKKIYALFFVNSPLIDVICVISTSIWYL